MLHFSNLGVSNTLLICTSRRKGRQRSPNSKEGARKGLPGFYVIVSVDLEKSAPRSPSTCGVLWEPKCQRGKDTCTVWMQPHTLVSRRQRLAKCINDRNPLNAFLFITERLRVTLWKDCNCFRSLEMHAVAHVSPLSFPFINHSKYCDLETMHSTSWMFMCHLFVHKTFTNY